LNHNPNLFIVGAAKAGTTSLYNYLDMHKDVYMSPIKEPHFFSKDIRHSTFTHKGASKVSIDMKKYLAKEILEKRHIEFIENFDDYIELYRDVKNEKIIGEISTGYLFSNVAAAEIYNFNPDAKIIFVLRNPIERAFSHWLMDLRGNDVCRSSFLDAVQEDQHKEDKGWGKSHLYIELGLYYQQVKRYFDIFPREQLLVLLFDDMKTNPKLFYKTIYSFLNIEYMKMNTTQKHNQASILKYPYINLIVKKFKLNLIASKLLPFNVIKFFKNILLTNESLPKLTTKEREELLEYFEGDIKKLEKLIDKDLSVWLK